MENYSEVMADIQSYIKEYNVSTGKCTVTLPHWYKFQDYIASEGVVERYYGQLTIEIDNHEPQRFKPCLFQIKRDPSPHKVCSQQYVLDAEEEGTTPVHRFK
ncbi:unnamed protein product [Gongylonema pulchrum]|uniref:PAZ domain-containing protein n=1 Tax=Gongylonema pulchrum TaxID=637853 RepID=A0A183CUG2_9BILA|nr:unnamed protein product [Gongylonema pulchrum]